jgi:hypothetical protein
LRSTPLINSVDRVPLRFRKMSLSIDANILRHGIARGTGSWLLPPRNVASKQNGHSCRYKEGPAVRRRPPPAFRLLAGLLLRRPRLALALARPLDLARPMDGRAALVEVPMLRRERERLPAARAGPPLRDHLDHLRPGPSGPSASVMSRIRPSGSGPFGRSSGRAEGPAAWKDPPLGVSRKVSTPVSSLTRTHLAICSGGWRPWR